MKDVELSIDQYSINVAKGLIMDTVRNANSGHTGGPLSSLDFTYVLFKEVLKFDPENPNWEDRDRFVMSVGHESALLYTMLCFVGWLEIPNKLFGPTQKTWSWNFSTPYAVTQFHVP